MIKHSEEFKQEAVRIALTSGLSRERVASDLGVGKSTLGKWIAQYRPTDLVSAPQADLARENERLRLENRVLREEREAQKRRLSSSRAKGREVRLCAPLAAPLAGGVDVSRFAGQRAWLSFLALTPDQSAGADGHESAGPYQGTI